MTSIEWTHIIHCQKLAIFSFQNVIQYFYSFPPIWLKKYQGGNKIKPFNFQALIIFGLIIILALVFGFVMTDRASASLGNQGTPVRCTVEDLDVGEYIGNPYCYYLTDFRNHFAGVPASYYLVITDIEIIPQTPGSGSGFNFITFYNINASQGGGEIYRITYNTNDRTGYSIHDMITPYLVVQPGNSFDVFNSNSSTNTVNIYITGLLMTDITYLPIITR